jgi:hypothetical protein
MDMNYCPNCGAPLKGQDQAEQMPEDYAPDLPAENQDPPMAMILQQAQALLEHAQSDSNSPVVGQLSNVRRMVDELTQAMDRGESLDLPYYRETAFELKRELDRLGPIATLARFRYGGG